MPKPPKVLCHVSQSQLAKSHGNAYVWISEEILAHTFNSYSRCHKRHGSNVPGPLEAQRRAARRRNTNVAYTSPYNPGYQPFEVFGAKPKDGWWDKHLLQANALTLSSSWLWSLLSPQKPLQNDPSCQHLEILDIPDEIPQVKNVRKVEEELLQCLKHIHTHDALVARLGKMAVDLTRYPQLTQTMLKHILQQDWQFDHLVEFLLEPQMNPPGSAHFSYLLENLARYSSIVKELVQRKVFTRAATLGLIDVEELKNILMLVPKLDLDSSLPQHTFPWALFSIDLLSALSCSKVIHLSDLGQPFVIEWLKLIKSRGFQPAKEQLLWTLYRYLGHSGRKALRKVVVNSVQTIDHTCLSHIPALANFLLSQPHGYVRDILLPVTQNLLSEAAANGDDLKDDHEHDEDAAYRKALLKTVLEHQKQVQSIANMAQDNLNLNSQTQMPVNLTKKHHFEFGSSTLHRQPSDLEKWWTLLRILNEPGLTSFQLKPGFFRAYPNDTDIGVEEQQLFVVQLWISMALFDHCRWKLEEPSTRKLSSLFPRLFSQRNAGGSEDKLVNFIRTIQSLQLPAKHQLLRYAAFAYKELSIGGQTYGMLVKKVDELEHGQVLNVSKTRYYIAARSSSPALLSEVAESMNEDMKTFETTCRSVIRETEKGPVLVSRLLTHNHQLKFVLRQAAILSFSSPLRWENEEAARKSAIGNYSFNHVVNMINNFAAECANNHHMSPRNCFRKVFWYYKFLHRCRGPIKPDLLDALWVAGVQRYNGSSRLEIITWLYKTSVAYLGEQRAKIYLQRAVLRDRTLDRIAASVAGQENKQQVYENTEQIIPPTELLPEHGKEEGWSEESGAISSAAHSASADNSKQTRNSNNFHDANFRTASLSQITLSTRNRLSEVRCDVFYDAKHVVPQAKSLYEAAQALADLDEADVTFEWSSTSKAASKERDTVAGVASGKRLASQPVLQTTNTTPTSSLFLNNQESYSLDVKTSVDFNDGPLADGKYFGQTIQQEHNASTAGQYKGDELTANGHEEKQDNDLQEGTGIDTWLGEQYTTLEARMVSAQKGKVKKPGRRRSKLLTWM